MHRNECVPHMKLLCLWVECSSALLVPLLEARIKTCSSPRCPQRSHSLVCIKNRLFNVGIGPIINKELDFYSDLIALIVHAFIVRYQYQTINFRYKNVTQSALFFAYKNVPSPPGVGISLWLAILSKSTQPCMVVESWEEPRSSR